MVKSRPQNKGACGGAPLCLSSSREGEETGSRTRKPRLVGGAGSGVAVLGQRHGYVGVPS